MIELSHGTREDAESWVGHVAEPRPCALTVSDVHGQIACAMVDDANPIYWGGQLAAEAFGCNVVPPAMLMTYSLPLPWSPNAEARRPPLWAHVPLPGDTMINVATTSTFHAPLPASVGLTAIEKVVSVSELRTTRVGAGHFLTTRADYYDAHDVLLASQDNTMLRYASGSVSIEGSGAQMGRPKSHDDVVVFDLDIDRRRLALNVAATWDFFPGHHSDEYARSQGVPASYVNTLFLHAVVDRAVTEHACAANDEHSKSWFMPVRRHMVMRRPVVVGSRIIAYCGNRPDEGFPDRFRVTVTDASGSVCVEATVDIARIDVEPP